MPTRRPVRARLWRRPSVRMPAWLSRGTGRGATDVQPTQTSSRPGKPVSGPTPPRKRQRLHSCGLLGQRAPRPGHFHLPALLQALEELGLRVSPAVGGS